MGGEVRVNPDPEGLQLGATVTALTGGNYVVFWYEVVGEVDAAYILNGRVFAPDGSVIRDIDLGSVDDPSQGAAFGLAALETGGFAVIYPPSQGDAVNIQRFDSTGAAVGSPILPPLSLSDDTPSLAAHPDGGFYAVYDSPLDGAIRLVAQRYGADGAPIGTAFEIATDHAQPASTVLANGDLLVAWEDVDQTEPGTNIHARTFAPDGVPRGPLIRVDNEAPLARSNASVAAFADGSFAVTWLDGTTDRVFVRLFAASGDPLGDAVEVDPDFTGEEASAHVIAIEGGGFVVTYVAEGKDDYGSGLFARRLDTDGQPAGAPQQIAETVEGIQRSGAYNVAVLADGTLIFSWFGNGDQPGQEDELGVFVRRFELQAASNVPTDGNDVLTGTPGDDTLYGGLGDDMLYGGVGDDWLFGQGGADTTDGGFGDDVHIVDNVGDVVIERAGEGNDLVFTQVDFALAAGLSVETLSTQTHAGTAPINLTGNGLANTLYGNNGANLLNGNGGADIMIGLGGDDVYVVDNDGDQVIETAGQGNDVLLTYVSYVLSNRQEVETLSTVAHQDMAAIDLYGNDYANHLIGNFGANYLNGRGGADLMTGLKGDDTYVIDHSGDAIQESIGEGNDVAMTFVSYTLAAGVEVELLSTAVHRDVGAIDLTGNEFAQTLIGNFGDNWLDGKGGSDTLRGFAGADTFAFTTALGASNVDTVEDFEVGVDKIALDDAIFTALSTGSLSAAAFHIGASATSASHRILYDSATGALFYDADGNGAGAAVQFATLQAGLTTLSASDFIVI